MKTSIKQVLLALLLSIFTTYGMEKNVIVSANSETFTMNGVPMPYDNLKEIFKLSCSDETIIRHSAKTMGRCRSVCRYWHDTLNPLAIRQLLNWNPQEIISELKDIYPYYNIKFLADSIKDQPHIYAQINMNDLIRYSTQTNVKTLLENGANPNHIRDGKTPLLCAIEAKRMEVFKLLLSHGGNIYQDCGDGDSILFKALDESKLIWSTFFGFCFYFGYLSSAIKDNPNKTSIINIIMREARLLPKHIFNLMLSISIIHPFVSYLLKTNQQLLITILKEKYWKKLATFNRF